MSTEPNLKIFHWKVSTKQRIMHTYVHNDPDVYIKIIKSYKMLALHPIALQSTNVYLSDISILLYQNYFTLAIVFKTSDWFCYWKLHKETGISLFLQSSEGNFSAVIGVVFNPPIILNCLFCIFIINASYLYSLNTIQDRHQVRTELQTSNRHITFETRCNQNNGHIINNADSK